MGNKIITPSVQSTVLDEGGKILSDGLVNMSLIFYWKILSTILVLEY